MVIADSIMAGQTINVEDFRESLLAWYDRHRRVLPWRAGKQQTPNPYHVWLSEIMLQQTTVPAVIPYFEKFIWLWPTVSDLASAPQDEVMQNWAGLGYYARARNLHKCAKIIAENHNGVFPDTYEGLKALPGIGDYTAAAISAIAFNKESNVVDGNVERVMSRIFDLREPVPASKPKLKALAADMAAGERKRPGDYAQALMDLGATICIPANPRCVLCPIAAHCEARVQGTAAGLPMRAPKAAKPQRHGYIYWIEGPGGQVLLQRRPEKGLLGGMTALPTSEWVEKTIEKPHLANTLKMEETNVRVLHSFTHFDLELVGVRCKCPTLNHGLDNGCFWVTIESSKDYGLPTVFKKAFRQFLK
jgi:A/G-specific adenine glycosylase